MKTNNQSAVYKHLNSERSEDAKLYLATQKVELGATADLEKSQKKLLKASNKMEQSIRKADKAYDLLIAAQKDMEKLDQLMVSELKDYFQAMGDVKEMAKELGVDPENVQAYKGAEGYYDVFRDDIKTLQKTLASVKQGSKALQGI